MPDNQDEEKLLKEYDQVRQRYEEVEFQPVYRAEGATVSIDRLMPAARGNVGRWFSKKLRTAEEYRNGNTSDNKEIYCIFLPEGFVAAGSRSIGHNKTEILVPRELAEAKVKYESNVTSRLDKNPYIAFIFAKEQNLSYQRALEIQEKSKGDA